MAKRREGESSGRLVVLAQNCRGCRSCQLACSFRKHNVFNPGKAMIVMERDLVNGRAAPMIKPLGCDLCTGDPACAKACKYGAITYEEGPADEKILVRPSSKEAS